MVSNPVTSVKDWKHKFAFIKIESLERSWNFGFVAPALNLEAAARKYSAEVQKLEALGIVSTSPTLLSNESLTAARVFVSGR